MLDFGVVDDLDYLYGVHVRPVQEVEDGKAAPAILHGAGYFVEGNITGEDAHGARPHLGINAIEVGASLVHKLAHIHVDPAVPHSVKVTKFIAGGESGNVIPGNASFSIDARAQKNDTMREIKAKVEKAVQATAQFYGADIRLNSVRRSCRQPNRIRKRSRIWLRRSKKSSAQNIASVPWRRRAEKIFITMG